LVVSHTAEYGDDDGLDSVRSTGRAIRRKRLLNEGERLVIAHICIDLGSGTVTTLDEKVLSRRP
jgi:hypothetical protein